MCGRLCALPGRCRVAPRQESAACAPGRLVAAGTGACARAARRIEALALPWQPSGLQARLQPASLQRACLEQCAGGVTWQMLCCGAVRALSWAWGCCEDTARGEQQVPVGRGVHGCLCRDTWAGSGEGTPLGTGGRRNCSAHVAAPWRTSADTVCNVCRLQSFHALPQPCTSLPVSCSSTISSRESAARSSTLRQPSSSHCTAIYAASSALLQLAPSRPRRSVAQAGLARTPRRRL